ncbi:histidine kinase dimerization/phosphoacceptor domain -containing protein [Devosia sp. UYZn731]|uniref:histidine kinase dimerization/phosphoacceptor domain -containing protein n=1 Tax=Devosia sp. UYZn731 TaxID=3156345 RepID=UPI003393783F
MPPVFSHGADQEAQRAEQPDITLCDVEPIHVPGSIQPHGLLLIADERTLRVTAGAGDIEARLEPDWLGKALDDLLRQDIRGLLEPVEHSSASAVSLVQVRGQTETFDVSLYRSSDLILAQLEPAPQQPAASGGVLTLLDNAGMKFARAADITSLCQDAALLFRELTGFDRVMIYRFLDSDAGCVMAEAQAPELHSFLHHHFPASDIPRQARALYVRNRVRVIPDVAYVPAIIRPATAGHQLVDLSDVTLRSVSPIHIQYLKNMGVGASASVSIVKDGVLWGLVACHNMTPRNLTYDVRIACRALASSLSRQIRAKEEAENYRERLRLRSAEDAIVAHLDRHGPLDQPDPATREDMRQMLGAEGFATVRGQQVELTGICPTPEQVLDLAAWLDSQTRIEAFRTNTLPALFPAAEAYQDRASGVLAIAISSDEASLFIWFRVEHLQVIEWAGNPHKAVPRDPNVALTPRASFEAWSETVRGKSRPWTLAEVEAAHRLRNAVFEARQNRRLQDLNRDLAATLADKESLLRQKDYLVKEVNHRVQNSLQLVSSFLNMQARSVNDAVLSVQLDEAQRRLSAVALVHKRLYRDDNFETIDLGRYLEELCQDIQGSMGDGWQKQFTANFAPVLISADRAINIGLVLTELIINANKYAYAGLPGPLSVSLEQHRSRFTLVVADRGQGDHKPGAGFGTRMMKAMVDRLGGTIAYNEASPGLQIVITAPIEETGV